MQSKSKLRTLSIIIPCYNEAGTISEVVEKVKHATLPIGWEREIIIVDDGSEDDTITILRTIESSVNVIYRNKNNGKGAAVKEGLSIAKGDYCIIQDGDLELNPAQFQDLLRPIIEKQADATFGYRILTSRDSSKNPVLFYGGRLVSILFNIVFATKFRDIPCCYKLFPRTCIPALLNTPSDDFVFDAIEMTYIINRECSIEQIPVTYHPRSHAQGKKIQIRHGLYCAITIILLRLGLHHRPLSQELPRFMRYIFSGITTVAFNLGAFFILTEWVHVWYLTASIVAFVISYCVNFLLHKFWTFKSLGIKGLSSQLPLHLGLSLINLAINTFIVYTLVEYLHIWHLGAQVATVGIIALESFFLTSRYIFKR